MKIGVFMILIVVVAACSPAVTPASPSFAPDPDTEPLPSAAKTHIPDPRSPAAPPQPEPAPAVATDTKATKEAKPEPSPDVRPEVKPDPKPAPKVAPVASSDCGSKDNPCPMQKLMRGFGAASTPDALEAAFNRIAAVSPNAGWQWSAIAKKGAELAKAGDTATAKKQCKACHDQYRDAYKSQYRARKL